MILNSPYISGSLTVTGNTNLIGALTVTGSLAGTATSSSFAYTASSAVSAYTAASAVNATTALTASYATSFTVGGTLTAQTLVVQTITSSIDFVTGSTRFGSLLTNTHTFTGSLQVTGSGPHTIFGNVGIGTTSPSTRLDVRTDTGVLIRGATSNSDAILSFLPTTGGRQYDFRNFGSSFGIVDSSANITRMYFNFSGNTGIGLTDPSALLHISGSGSGSLFRISSHVSSSIFFVSGSGNVGIGTTTPARLLHLTGSGDTYIRVDGNNIQSLFGTDNIGTYIGQQGAFDLRIITNAAERFRITSAGTASFTSNTLSNSADAATINLKQNSTTANTGIYLERSGEQKGYYIYMGGSLDSLTFQRNNAGTKGDVMSLTRDGNVLIGGTTQLQSALLSVYGSVLARNGGVDASYADAFIAQYSGNNNEANAILTSVSTTAQNSGFRFAVSNGAGSAGRTNMMDITRSGVKFQNGASYINYYEEGTWTPAFAQAGTPSYTTQFGRYTRIGNMVYCTIALRATSISGGSTIQITGLPFSAGDASDTGQRATYNPRLGGHINGLTETTAKFRVTGGTTMEGVKGDGDTTFMTAAQFTSGGSIQLTGQFWYYV